MLHGVEHKNTTIYSRFSESRKRKSEVEPDGDKANGVKMSNIFANNRNVNGNYYDLISSNMNMFVYPLLARSVYDGTVGSTIEHSLRGSDQGQTRGNGAESPTVGNPSHKSPSHSGASNGEDECERDEDEPQAPKPGTSRLLRDSKQNSSDTNNNDTVREKSGNSSNAGKTKSPTMRSANDSDIETVQAPKAEQEAESEPGLPSELPPKLEEACPTPSFGQPVTYRRACHICGRVFTRPNTLGWHMKMHESTPFKCKVSDLLHKYNVVHKQRQWGSYV